MRKLLYASLTTTSIFATLSAAILSSVDQGVKTNQVSADVNTMKQIYGQTTKTAETTWKVETTNPSTCDPTNGPKIGTVVNAEVYENNLMRYVFDENTNPTHDANIDKVYQSFADSITGSLNISPGLYVDQLFGRKATVYFNGMTGTSCVSDDDNVITVRLNWDPNFAFGYTLAEWMDQYQEYWRETLYHEMGHKTHIGLFGPSIYRQTMIKNYESVLGPDVLYPPKYGYWQNGNWIWGASDNSATGPGSSQLPMTAAALSYIRKLYDRDFGMNPWLGGLDYNLNPTEGGAEMMKQLSYTNGSPQFTYGDPTKGPNGLYVSNYNQVEMFFQTSGLQLFDMNTKEINPKAQELNRINYAYNRQNPYAAVSTRNPISVGDPKQIFKQIAISFQNPDLARKIDHIVVQYQQAPEDQPLGPWTDVPAAWTGAAIDGNYNQTYSDAANFPGQTFKGKYFSGEMVTPWKKYANDIQANNFETSSYSGVNILLHYSVDDVGPDTNWRYNIYDANNVLIPYVEYRKA